MMFLVCKTFRANISKMKHFDLGSYYSQSISLQSASFSHAGAHISEVFNVCRKDYIILQKREMCFFLEQSVKPSNKINGKTNHKLNQTNLLLGHKLMTRMVQQGEGSVEEGAILPRGVSRVLEC